ncbi:MAG: VOC family protein [Lachnospiraceae bacterium]
MNGSFSKPKLVQVGLVVRDLDKTMQQFKLLLGAEPDRVIEKSPSAPGPKYYLGQERDFYQRAALYSMNGIEFEILQPYDDRSALTDFLDERGEGIHHVAFDTDNFDAFAAHLAENGAELVQTGPNSRHPALKWGFFSTNDKLGTIDRGDKFPGSCKYRGRGKGRISPPF